MLNRSRTTMAVAVIAALATTASVTPSFAHSSSYCRDYARKVADHGSHGFDVGPLLPLALLAGTGAVVGAVVPGLAISAGTGALIGGGTGLALGATHHKHNGYSDREYAEAYAECRAGR